MISSEYINKHWILAGAVLSVWVVLYLPYFGNMAGQWGHEDYSHAYLVPPVFLYLLWLSKDRFVWSTRDAGLWGFLIIICSMLVMSMGRLGSLETLIYFSMWMSLLGIFLFIFGTAVLRHITFPFAVLLFAIPLPAFLNNMVSFKLKLWSSALAEQILKLLSVPVFREGNIIDLGVTQLQVVDACSGLRYLFPTMLMAMLIGRFFLRSSTSRIILFALSPLLSLLSNSMRVAVTGVLARYIDPRLAEGFFHDFSGWLVYMFTLVFLGGVTLFLRKLETSRTMVQDDSAGRDTAVYSGYGIKRPMIKTAAILLVFISSLLLQSHMLHAQISPERKDFDCFPDRIAGWEGERLYLSQGILDSLWADDYVSGSFFHPETGNSLHLLVSYYEAQTTRKTAHAPTSCLLGSGWLMQSRELAPPSPVNGRDFPVQSMVMEQGGRRILANFWFDQRGRHITSEYWNKAYLFLDAVLMRRTDGALVRVEMFMLPGQSREEAQVVLDGFVAELKELLGAYVPGA
ncbi:eight transmembrane protein EpsH [Desulfonatronospira thiodismutans ASO3-1]|uniref:Eight transmembrane protein EpsH n=1 Tax=Desulfonatronospira thiodismutans ASO3-1 TaxID=555779 RepID=D6SKS2_9BACT|nr:MULTISPECIES: VPLPA-CTERM-specific exosortase XrtD [Desulfonatronospira]EFI35283.1 eight transmembrane protein EpsH [Desulfonatronospira thiodismutans ASO3-1]RQD73688.1 MAG: VPLPA-CTERM-specific exosortase XrtD [Desulfonatronospira sp. MSAO_Bac3]